MTQKVMDLSLSLLLDGRHLGVGWLVVSTFMLAADGPSNTSLDTLCMARGLISCSKSRL